MATDLITCGECVKNGWNQSEKKRTWDKERLDYEEFPFRNLIWTLILSSNILAISSPMMFGFMPFCYQPHGHRLDLVYHSEHFHIRIIVSSDTLNGWLLSHALIPTLSSLHTQSDASPLIPQPPISFSLSTIWWTLEVLCHQHLSFLTSNLDQSHNPHLF